MWIVCYFAISEHRNIVLVVLSSYLKVPLHSLWHSLVHHSSTHPLFGKETEKNTGVIIDRDTKECVCGAEVFLLNMHHKILAHTVSDKNGRVSFVIHMNTSNYQIEIMGDGYQPEVYDIQENASQTFYISKSDHGFSSIRHLKHYVHDITEVGFEVFLVIALVFEVVIGMVLGWMKVLIFVIASIIALIVWFGPLVFFRIVCTEETLVFLVVLLLFLLYFFLVPLVPPFLTLSVFFFTVK